MSKVFLSHSSKDKTVVTNLANDLRKLGHDVWLDAWEIKVGDCIMGKVERGLEDSEYVVLVLSQNAVESGWVDKEWKTKYWEEINQKQVKVLPALIESCEIPTLLKTKKYADFRENYAVGLVELSNAIPMSAIVKIDNIKETDELFKDTDTSRKINDFIVKIQDPSTCLSKCLSEMIEVAVETGDSSFQKFLKYELTGWTDEALEDYGTKPTYRILPIYLSLTHKINLQYVGWGSSSEAVFQSIENSIQKGEKNFFLNKIFISESIFQLEDVQKKPEENSIISIVTTWKDLFGNDKFSTPVYGYMRANTTNNLIQSVRREATSRLLGLLSL